MKGTKLAAAVAALMLVSAPAAMAIDLKMPGAKPAAPAAGAEVDAVAMQEGIVQRYVEAATYVNTAQTELARAFELKDQVAALEADAAYLKSGATVDKDAIKKQRELSDSVSAAIDKKIAEGASLSDEGRKHYVASLEPLGRGVSAASKLPAEASSFSDAAQAQIKTASLTEKAAVASKLSAGLYLAKEIPGFSTRTADSLKKIVTYAQNKGIPVSKDATAMIGM